MFISRFWCAHISRHLNFAIWREFHILNHFKFTFWSTTIYSSLGMLFNMSLNSIKRLYQRSSNVTVGLDVNSNNKAALKMCTSSSCLYVNYFSVLSQVTTSSIYTKSSGEKMNSKKSDFVKIPEKKWTVKKWFCKRFSGNKLVLSWWLI